MRARYRVDVWESERGWGRSLLESKDFESKADAQSYVHETNSKNNLPSVPDYYIFADLPRLVDLDESN